MRREVDVDGLRVTVHLFSMRACFSGAAFAVAFSLRDPAGVPGGGTSRRSSCSAACPAQVRYDNLTSAVKQVLRGRRRVETDRFVALRSHYLFESAFTRSGSRGRTRRAAIEGEVGRFRRNHLVPVPERWRGWPS